MREQREALAFSIFLSFCIDLSTWSGYGSQIWYFIAAFYLIGMVVDRLLEEALGDTMFVTPLSTSFATMQGLITLGANDFVGFLLSFAVDTACYWILTVYLNLLVDTVSDNLLDQARALRRRLGACCARCSRGRLALELEREREAWATVKPDGVVAEVGHPEESDGGPHAHGPPLTSAQKGATVEALCSVMQAYVVDTISNLQGILVIGLFILFRDEVGIPNLYGIRETDMSYYLYFALVQLGVKVRAWGGRGGLTHSCLGRRPFPRHPPPLLPYSTSSSSATSSCSLRWRLCGV